MVARRGLLLAGAAGVLLGGCGEDRPAKVAPTRSALARDAQLVAGLVGLELEGIGLYRAHGGDGTLVARLLEQEHEHATRLQAALRDLGGRPRAASAAPAVAGVTPLALAQRIERTQLAAYLGALPQVAEPEVRALLATIAVTEAEHLAAVDGALGNVPAPSAFVTGRRVL